MANVIIRQSVPYFAGIRITIEHTLENYILCQTETILFIPIFHLLRTKSYKYFIQVHILLNIMCDNNNLNNAIHHSHNDWHKGCDNIFPLLCSVK